MIDFTGMFGKGYVGKTCGNFLSTGNLLVYVVIGALAIFWLWMLIDCLKKNFKKDMDKLVWVIILLFTHILGAVLYYFLVKAQRKR